MTKKDNKTPRRDKKREKTKDKPFEKSFKKAHHRAPGGMKVGDILQGYITTIFVDDNSTKLSGLVKLQGRDIFIEMIPDDSEAGDFLAFKLTRRLKKMWLASFIRFVEQEVFNVGVFRAKDHAIHSIHRKRSFHPLICNAPLEDETVIIFEEKNGIALVQQIIGPLNSPQTYSKLAAINHDVWYPVTQEEEDHCRNMTVPTLGHREDLRDIPLVTIDGFDARDFDDAVFAEKDLDPQNPGGYKLIVAIADVSYYVHKGDIVDEHALERGNSVYFPDYVLPMLPERLCNDLCSLRPFVERACVACHMTVTKNGRIKSFRFSRALMKSHGRLTYEEVEKALIRGKANKNTEPVLTSTLLPVFEAYQLLKMARNERGALELDSDEHKIVFDESGEVKDVELKKSLTSHQVIEEFMVAANVCAAKALAHAGWPCVYRIHDKPDPIRLQSIRSLLSSLKLPPLRSDHPSQKDLSAILFSVKETPYAQMINNLILRSQAQAHYSPNNIGHFGLNLQDYAHFTSPIRRYSDLVLHRLLIEKYALGEGGYAYENLIDITDHISKTERRASAAEREANDRFLARHLQHHIGEEFDGVVTGVTNAGLFISLDKTHAEGFLPKRFLLDVSENKSSYFDQTLHMLRVGKTTYHMGMRLRVELIESDPTLCEITFAPSFSHNKEERRQKSEKKAVKDTTKHKKDAKKTAPSRTSKNRKKS